VFFCKNIAERLAPRLRRHPITISRPQPGNEKIIKATGYQPVAFCLCIVFPPEQNTILNGLYHNSPGNADAPDQPKRRKKMKTPVRLALFVLVLSAILLAACAQLVVSSRQSAHHFLRMPKKCHCLLPLMQL